MIPSGFGPGERKAHFGDKKIGRLRRPSGLGTFRPLRIWDDFRPGPDSEFDLAEVPGSFFVNGDKSVSSADYRIVSSKNPPPPLFQPSWAGWAGISGIEQEPPPFSDGAEGAVFAEIEVPLKDPLRNPSGSSRGLAEMPQTPKSSKNTPPFSSQNLAEIDPLTYMVSVPVSP